MAITVRQLSIPTEFAEAQQVQKSAWGMEDIMVMPKEVMIAMASNGGLVLGAFDGRKMVGVSVSFPGRNHGRFYMYSHITGVAKEYQSRGVGRILKEKQSELSMEKGYKLLAWTFDPLISRNAYFNFRKLGVASRTYFVNYYGPMNDSINFGWETDRFLAERFFDRRILGRLRGASNSKGAYATIRTRHAAGYLRCEDWSIDLKATAATVDIPRDVLVMKASHPEDASRWRLATREIFQAYFRAGFTAIRLMDRQAGFSYLLKKVPLPRNIFNEDQSAPKAGVLPRRSDST